MSSSNELTQDELVGFHSQREIAFTWYPRTHQFNIDDELLNKCLMMNQSIDSIDGFFKLFSEADAEDIRQLLQAVIAGEEPKPLKVCIVTANAGISLVLVSAKKVSNNLVAGMLMPLFLSPTPEDLTRFFHQIFENQHRGMVVTDAETRIVACNSRFERATGYQVDEVIGKKTSLFNAGKHGRDYFEKMWAKIDEVGYWSGLILSKTKSGEAIPQDLQILKLVSTRDNVYYLGITQDLSNKLYRVAGMEHGGVELLTQLPNEEDYSGKLKQLVANANDNIGILVVSFAPEFEESVEFDYKKQVASALAFRKKGVLAGFLKNAVFSIAIVYEHTPQKPHSLSIFTAIREQFNALKQSVDADVYDKITDSIIGASVFGLDAKDAPQLISHSLQAMFEKHSSSNSKICFYNRTLHGKVKRREMLESIVINAIQKKSVEVYFQPIICTNQWKVTKLEALCRFRDNEGALLDTEKMVKIAEDLGLVSDLDIVVAEKAVDNRDHLVTIFGRDVEVTINISLNSDKPIKALFTDLMSIFRSRVNHLPYITVELTETAFFNSEHEGGDILFKLRKKGLSIAIDDFGTGYSSFSYLKDGNFDILKIDRDFITELTQGSNNYYIVKMITHLAHTLGVKVVAEGVESIQEVTILKDLKVDYLQGFYFDQPMPATKLTPNVNSTVKRKLADLIELDDEEVSLFTSPPKLSANHTLDEVKQLFEKSEYTAFPVVVDKKCVGVITRERYNLHATPSLGTARETLQDLRSLNRTVNAVMETSFTRVHETINSGEIHEKIKNKNSFPWVGINDSGDYIGIVDHLNIIRFLNTQ